ncbi:MAG: TIGR04086 family membrane protein [Tepidibacter sp.]|uniref:TIGR04086 family membrane protein n=1 Tax=Tepidibacter sp. TaxID=2529387 RepID=UPI0025E9D5F1|nr:TIGR04086 family membrane protein [Tepidibacter sp.]MCT4509880.1 TIGR04086 family membrane protein [Tepidibacter sp.]
MKRATYFLKALGYSYLITIVLVLIYNLVLTYTSVSVSTMPLMTSIIVTLGIACAGFYIGYKNGSDGFLYGILAGALYVLFMIIMYFLANENFKFEMNMLYKMLLNTLTGGIGGIIGVNMKKD